MVQEPGMNFTMDGFADLIRSYGPLWVAERTPYGGNHIVVVTGMVSDGSADGSGTQVRVLDPLGRAPGSPASIGRPLGPIGGSRYLVPWNNFVTMYENRISVGAGGGVDGQIIHATGNGGRSPASGSQFSWTYALSARALEEIPLGPDVGGQSIPESMLRAGDIIVSTTSAFISGAIRAVSGSPVSHAGIYTGSGTIIEAIGAGVVERPIADSLRDDSLAVAFRKPGLTDAQAQHAVEFALAQVGRSYNYFGIVRQAAYRYHSSYCNLLPASLQDRCRGVVARVDLGTSDGSTFFCSQLVIAAYREAGAPLTTTDPQWTDPGQLAELRLNGMLDYVGHLKAPPLATGSALGYGGNGGGTYARPLDGGAGAAVGAAIIGAVISAVAGNSGDVTWSLDQMNGIKDPGDNRANRGTAPFQDTDLLINDIKGSTIGGVDEIYCHLRVAWQYNGRAVANVRIIVEASDDAIGAGLRVEARITNDARLLRDPGSTVTYGAVRVNVTYSLGYSWSANETRNVELELYGNGHFTRRTR
jgi:uncharacterized protein YycO